MRRAKHSGLRTTAEWIFLLGTSIVVPMLILNHLGGLFRTWALPLH